MVPYAITLKASALVLSSIIATLWLMSKGKGMLHKDPPLGSTPQEETDSTLWKMVDIFPLQGAVWRQVGSVPCMLL